MKIVILLFGLLISMKNLKSQNFDLPVYAGNDLGLTYSKKSSDFRLWAPTATEVELRMYTSGDPEENSRPIDLSNVFKMNKSKGGTWTISIEGDHSGKFYNYRVKINDKWSHDAMDPYAKAAGVNGKRAQILDLNSTDPVNWEKDKRPIFKNKTDAIIYELHVRDASISTTSGIKNKGKFIGLTEKGTVNSAGQSTGIDHIKELGVTHVHLLPVYDYNSVDESRSEVIQYNWGYDPLNYNVPEGSYATNANDGSIRIKEFKQLVKTFHENGLRVVMDVVYNHTALSEKSNFNQLVPDYYYRHTSDGKFSNATACGNETASERFMMRKFIVESMKYWVQEYHIDGFRIDLMGVHDIETVNMLSKELHKLLPDILLYGEGWTAGSSPLPDAVRALKKNAWKLDRVAVFSDDIRDGIKGHVFTHTDKGFVSGKTGMEESIKFGIVASMAHPQIDYSKVKYSKVPYARQPHHTVTYAECHDNHVLWDKLAISAKEFDEKERLEMYKLALSIVLTSQGISFLHAGSEFVRTKKGVENSFESPDSINAINWDLKTTNATFHEYVKKLIKMRKEHPAFRMTTAKQVTDNLTFLEVPEGMVGYQLNGAGVKDSWKDIRVYFNGSGTAQSIELPLGNWTTAIHNNEFKEDIISKEVIIQPRSCIIIKK